MRPRYESDRRHPYQRFPPQRPPYRPGPPGGYGGPLGPPMRPPPQLPPFTVDREKTCPLFIKVFIGKGRHSPLTMYDQLEQKEATDLGCVTADIYTWPDATLREFVEMLSDVAQELSKDRTRASFAFVYPDRKGKKVMKQVGSVWVGRKGEDDNKTLHHLQFQTGDYLDIAIFSP